MLVLLNTLWAAPVAVFLWTRRRAPNHRWLAASAAFGLVVETASLGLYSLYSLSPFTAPLGIIGLILVTLHVTPGYELAVATGLVPAGTVVEGASSVAVLNGIFWCVSYGTLGWVIDRLRSRRLVA